MVRQSIARALQLVNCESYTCIEMDDSAELNGSFLFTFQVLEAMMKNCGATVHVEVATRDFMEFFKEQANVSLKAKR